MTEVDPDPRDPADGQGTSALGGSPVPADGDPTEGGKRGQIGDAQQVEDSARALASATGVLRSTVGKQTGIKFVPSLTFVADIVPDTARELEEALERVRHADAELARAREGAQYAGEADPYRKPAVDEDEDEDGEADDDLVAVADDSDGRTDGYEDGRPSAAAAQRSAS